MKRGMVTVLAGVAVVALLPAAAIAQNRTQFVSETSQRQLLARHEPNRRLAETRHAD
jgi:hypothetical protein